MTGPELSHPLIAALACVLGWMGWSVLIGWIGNRLPLPLLRRDTLLTRPRPWGETAKTYEKRLGIRHWKDWLPDAGNAFPGGVRKASLVSRDPARLERLIAETRRAELVHLGVWPFWLATLVWMPPWGVLINLLFATAFNLPCIWLQRFNRLRLQSALTRVASTPQGRPSRSR